MLTWALIALSLAIGVVTTCYVFSMEEWPIRKFDKKTYIAHYAYASLEHLSLWFIVWGESVIVFNLVLMFWFLVLVILWPVNILILLFAYLMSD
jgi:hypothetical protein